MTDPFQARLDVTMVLVGRAEKMPLAVRASPGTAHAVLKDVQDWQTEADEVIEQFLSEQFASTFAASGFLGEEDGVSRIGRLRRVGDPIDGTANFVRVQPRFYVSLECNTRLIGVIVAPAHQETIHARLDSDAWLNGNPVRGSKFGRTCRGRRDPLDSFLCVSLHIGFDYSGLCCYRGSRRSTG